ncbi:MAG: SDR family oxidoreductase [Melioribacteraceae bacterium]
MENKIFSDLKNKVCVITGGSGVLGSVMAKGLAEAGVKIAILARNKERAESIAEEIQNSTGTEAIGISADVVDKQSLNNAKEIILKKFGKVDLLINAAGGNSPKATTKDELITDKNVDSLDSTFFGLELEGFQKVFDLNILGTLLPTMVFAKEMVENKSGAILNVSSMSAYHPLTKIPAYSASKSAINNFTEWLAVHFAKMNVRVNSIAPGFFLTNQNRFLLTDEKTNELTERGNKIISSTPMEKFGEPEDLIGATLFLLSDSSKFITGVVLPIDGGFNAFSGV